MQELATGVCSSGISVIVVDSDCVAMDLGGAEVKLAPKKGRQRDHEPSRVRPA